MMPSGLSGVMMVPSLSSISRHVSWPRIHGGTFAIVEMLLELASTSWLWVGASIQGPPQKKLCLGPLTYRRLGPNIRSMKTTEQEPAMSTITHIPTRSLHEWDTLLDG